jgi:hypothetical protein
MPHTRVPMVSVLPQGRDERVQEMATHICVKEIVRQDALVEQQLDALVTRLEVDGVHTEDDSSESLVERCRWRETEDRGQGTALMGDHGVVYEVRVTVRQDHSESLCSQRRTQGGQVKVRGWVSPSEMQPLAQSFPHRAMSARWLGE